MNHSTGGGDGAAVGSGRGAGVKVLVVDDHDAMRLLTTAILKRAGFAVLGAVGSGEEAIECLQQLQPHLVLMDVNMPGMGGVKATQLIRGCFPGIRIIGLSTEDDSFTVDCMMQAGASAFVSKDKLPTLIPLLASMLHSEAPAEVPALA